MGHLCHGQVLLIPNDMSRSVIAFQKLRRLENELGIYMTSPLVLMLPSWTQSEVASILQDIQTTLRQAIDSTWTQAPESFPNVDELIEKGTQMSLWLKDMATTVLRVTRSETGGRAI